MLNFFYFFNTFLFVSKLNSNLASGAIRLWIIVLLSKNQTQTCPAGQSPPGNIGSELESTSRTWNHNILLFCNPKTLPQFVVLYCVENPPHTWSYLAHGQWRPLGQCSCHRRLWNHQPSKIILEHSNKKFSQKRRSAHLLGVLLHNEGAWVADESGQAGRHRLLLQH